MLNRGVVKGIRLEIYVWKPKFRYLNFLVRAMFFGQFSARIFSTRHIKAVLYVKEHGKITNGEYKKINDCSHNKASTELKEIENIHKLLINKSYGAGSSYELIAQ
jgi:predicted HTH transcriptional regulator